MSDSVRIAIHFFVNFDIFARRPDAIHFFVNFDIFARRPEAIHFFVNFDIFKRLYLSEN